MNLILALIPSFSLDTLCPEARGTWAQLLPASLGLSPVATEGSAGPCTAPVPFQLLKGIWHGPVEVSHLQHTRSESRLVECPGSLSSCQTPLPWQGKGELSASWSPALLSSVYKHSWHCSLWSLSEPICFPSASSFLGITLGSTAMSGPQGISQQLGRGSLPLWGPATWSGGKG